MIVHSVAYNLFYCFLGYLDCLHILSNKINSVVDILVQKLVLCFAFFHLTFLEMELLGQRLYILLRLNFTLPNCSLASTF